MLTVNLDAKIIKTEQKLNYLFDIKAMVAVFPDLKFHMYKPQPSISNPNNLAIYISCGKNYQNQDFTITVYKLPNHQYTARLSDVVVGYHNRTPKYKSFIEAVNSAFRKYISYTNANFTYGYNMDDMVKQANDN